MKIKYKVLDFDTKELIGYERIGEHGHWEFKREHRKDWLMGVMTDGQVAKKYIRLQYIGIKDSYGEEIYDKDKIVYWYCYKTTQTHIGDNIIYGSYTEPDEPQLIKLIGEVYYDEDRCLWSNKIIGEIPYQFYDNTWFNIEDMIPLIHRDEYNYYEIASILNFDIDEEKNKIDDLIKQITDYESLESLMEVINKIKVIK